MQDSSAMDINARVSEATAEEQAAIMQLASLLEISIELAYKALLRSQWNFQVAVDAACQLASASSQSSAQPPLELSSAPASHQVSVASTSSVASQPPVRPSSASASRQAAVAPSQLRVEFSSALRAHASSSSSSSEFPSMSTAPPVLRVAGVKRMRSSLSDDVPDVFVSAAGPLEKKRRLSAAAGPSYSIPNNNSDEPAANPDLLKEHPLREEQRRSLGWMISQEARFGESADEDSDLLMRGGLLADRMGYGKTSTTIGLISRDVNLQLAQPTYQDIRDRYIPSDSTLIVCPSHLVEQWQGEFWKFLGPTGVEMSEPQGLEHKNLHNLEITFNFANDFASPKDFGISVTKACTGFVRITSIRSAILRELMRSCGVEGDIRNGDLIRKIQCRDVTGSGTDFSTGRSYTETIKNYTRSTFGQIQDFLTGKCFYTSKRIRNGDYPPVNGQPARPRWDSINLHLKIRAGSKVVFSIARPKTMQLTKVVQGEGPLKVLTIKTTPDLDLLQQQSFLSQFHVVLASAGIFFDMKYANYIMDAAGKGGLMENKLRGLGEKVREWCKSRDSFQELVLKRSPPLFEVVYWRRVVLDEFHESESWQYRVREMLRTLGAMYKWGLSGTPPLSDAAAVAEVAGLLGYSMPNKDGGTFAKALHYGRSTIREHPSSRDWFADKENQIDLQNVAEKFVREYIRQNTSQLIETIGVVEHEEFVDHTSEERLIYRQACHDQGIYDLTDGYSQISLSSREVLLKRSAHFDMGEVAESASAAVNRLGDQKKDLVEKMEKQLWIEVARAMLFKVWDSDDIGPINGKVAVSATKVEHPQCQAVLEQLLSASVADVESKLASHASFADSSSPNPRTLAKAMELEVKMLQQDGSLRLRPEVRFIQPVSEKDYYKDDHRHAVLHAIAKRVRNREAHAALSEMASCERACCIRLNVALCSGLIQLVTLLDKAHRSLQFYTQQVSNLTGEANTDGECSICLEGTQDISSMAILPCSHVFHAECIRAVLACNPLCPECRTPVSKSHISSVVMELKPPEPVPHECSAPSNTLTPAWKKNGSKLNAVAKRLRLIRDQDPKAKALVFVQWADLEAKVCQALRDHGIPYLYLTGDSRRHMSLGKEDGHVLRKFQEDDSPSSPYVLVLSLQRAAAGTNLTSASHVLFVHPMNAETVQTAAAYERQALARVRRIGQTRSEVHIWRFVTRQTVEEHIWKLHREAPENAEADRAVVGSAVEA